MADAPIREFGKRGRATIPAAAPVKRSGHVGLLVMGALAVGGGAFALMPRENCAPVQPGMAAPALPASGSGCASRGGSSSGGYGRSSSFGFYGGNSGRSSSATASDSAGGVSRGGFGSLAHVFGFSGRS